MNRQKILLSTIALLGLLWLGVWIHDWWGTITLDYENKPLGTVLRSFAKQSDLPVVTDLDETKPITIHVIRVPVAEALDALQAVAESRGRLLYLAAPNNADLQKGLSLLPGKLDSADWKTIEYRLPFMFLAGSEDLPRWGDTRKQTWNPTDLKDSSLVSFFENAAQTTDIRIVLPSGWNPKIQKSMSSGPLDSNLTPAGFQSDLPFSYRWRNRKDDLSSSWTSSRSRPGVRIRRSIWFFGLLAPPLVRRPPNSP
ncbi:MAG: hypothetical protein EBT69_01235 [Verrucomicrobia bacterium]|nr:hypothetical protein [Verrucomicrobiota bacterium]